jgi:hypothetical protein
VPRPPASDPDTRPLTDAQTSVLLDAVARASKVGLVLRTALFGVAILAAALAVLYTGRNGNEMVNTILGRDPAVDLLWERVISLTLPVLLFVVLGAVCVVGAYVLQSRALDERERALDAIARIAREAEGGVSRARTLARLSEDDLTHARREFAMQIAFGRASWWLAVGLLGVSVVYSMASGDLDAYSLAFGAGGVLSYLLGVAFKVPTRVRCNLASLSQRHLIVSGYVREIGLIEADAYRLIAQARRPSDGGAPPTGAITAAAHEIRAATGVAMERIERYCKSDGPSPADLEPEAAR